LTTLNVTLVAPDAANMRAMTAPPPCWPPPKSQKYWSAPSAEVEADASKITGVFNGALSTAVNDAVGAAAVGGGCVGGLEAGGLESWLSQPAGPINAASNSPAHGGIRRSFPKNRIVPDTPSLGAPRAIAGLTGYKTGNAGESGHAPLFF
jgi:hypothetical protein